MPDAVAPPKPVALDARGIVRPEAGLTRFQLDRYAPSPAVARFVDRYWVVTWDLTGQEPYAQPVFAHPVVNVVFGDGPPTVYGVTTAIGTRVLEGAGRALGIMFRPAGFRPFLGRVLSGITDQALALADVFGPQVTRLEAEVLAAGEPEAMAATADAFLAALVPPEPQPSEATSRRWSNGWPATRRWSGWTTWPTRSGSAPASSSAGSPTTWGPAPSRSSAATDCTRRPSGPGSAPTRTGPPWPPSSGTATRPT